MKKHVFIVNAHPDDLIGSAGMAFILSEHPDFELHIVDMTRGERGLVRHGVALEECAATRTKEEIAAETIQKRTDAFISISFNAITATFEFNGNVLAQSEQLFNSLRSHIRSSQSI